MTSSRSTATTCLQRVFEVSRKTSSSLASSSQLVRRLCLLAAQNAVSQKTQMLTHADAADTCSSQYLIRRLVLHLISDESRCLRQLCP